MHESIDIAVLARGLLERGYTTASLARAIGVSQPTVSRIATGATKSMAVATAFKLIALAGGEVRVPSNDRDAPDA